MKLRIAVLPATLAALLLAACGKDDGPLPPLAYVPADTPYVMGAIEPIPRAVADEWLALSSRLLPMYRDLLDQSIKELEAKPAEEAPGLPLLRGLRGLRRHIHASLFQTIMASTLPYDALHGMVRAAPLLWGLLAAGAVAAVRLAATLLSGA